MLTLSWDVTLYVCNYLLEKEVIAFAITSKQGNKLKHKFIFRTQVHIDKIIDLPHFDSFSNVIMSRPGKVPKSTTHIVFDVPFDDPIKDCVPLSVTHLTLHHKPKQIPANYVPYSIIQLMVNRITNIDDIIDHPYFDSFTNIVVDEYSGGKFPKSVTHFKFIADELFDISIPPTVTHLTFGYDFCGRIDGRIPESVTHLKLGNYFNKTIVDCIPQFVTHLEFSGCFNQPIFGCIPKSVTHLTFGDCFDQPIFGCIPKSVTHLTFGYLFNKPIDNCIPSSVVHLIFGYKFNHPIENMIPESATHITFGMEFDQSLNSIPNSVKCITLNRDYDRKINDDIRTKVTYLIQEIPFTLFGPAITGIRYSS